MCTVFSEFLHCKKQRKENYQQQIIPFPLNIKEASNILCFATSRRKTFYISYLLFPRTNDTLKHNKEAEHCRACDLRPPRILAAYCGNNQQYDSGC